LFLKKKSHRVRSFVVAGREGKASQQPPFLGEGKNRNDEKEGPLLRTKKNAGALSSPEEKKGRYRHRSSNSRFKREEPPEPSLFFQKRKETGSDGKQILPPGGGRVRQGRSLLLLNRHGKKAPRREASRTERGGRELPLLILNIASYPTVRVRKKRGKPKSKLRKKKFRLKKKKREEKPERDLIIRLKSSPEGYHSQ